MGVVLDCGCHILDPLVMVLECNLRMSHTGPIVGAGEKKLVLVRERNLQPDQDIS